MDRERRGGRVRRWPLAIALWLLLVVVVNVTFAVVAIGGADVVVESYHTEER